MAVRIYSWNLTVGDIHKTEPALATLTKILTPDMVDSIYYLTSLAKFDDRFVIPAAHREQAMEMVEFTGDTKGSIGFGFNESPTRSA